MSYQDSEKFMDAADAYHDALSISPSKLWIYEPLVHSIGGSGEFSPTDWEELLTEMEDAVRLQNSSIGMTTTTIPPSSSGSKARERRTLDLSSAYGDVGSRQLTSEEGALIYEAAVEGKGKDAMPDMSATFPGGSPMAYALGNAAENAGDHHTAWGYYTLANNLEMASHRPYTPKMAIQTVNYFKQFFHSKFWPSVEGVKGVGLKTDYPVFVVGLPYCGVELLEGVLNGHSSIFGLNAQPDYFASLNGQVDEALRYSVINRHAMATQTTAFADLEKGGWGAVKRKVNEFARIVLENMQKLSNHVAQNLVFPLPKHALDTETSNYFSIGLIHTFFPKAKIINLVRDPLDNILEMYLHRHGDRRSPMEFANAVESLVLHYISYMDLMHHWRNTLPEGTIIDVNYDELRVDPEKAVAPVLAALGLQWQPSMLDFRPSKLARRPTGFWRRYATEEGMASLISSLEGAVVMMEREKMLPFPHSMNWGLTKSYNYDRALGRKAKKPTKEVEASSVPKPSKAQKEKAIKEEKPKQQSKPSKKEKKEKKSKAPVKKASAADSPKPKEMKKKSTATAATTGNDGAPFTFPPLTGSDRKRLTAILAPLQKQFGADKLVAVSQQLDRAHATGDVIVDCIVAAALVLGNNYELQETTRLLERLIEVRSDVPIALVTLAQLYSSDNGFENNEKALEVSDKLIKLMPQKVDGLVSRSKVLAKINRVHEALDDLTAALEVDEAKHFTPDSLLARSKVLIARAQLYIRARLHSRAYVDLHEIIQRGTATTPQVYFLLGQTEITFAHIQKAIEACKRRSIFIV